MTMTFTRQQTSPHSGAHRGLATFFVALAMLSAPGVASADFLGEIGTGVTDHRGHNHSNETAQFGLVDGIDASCAAGPVCSNFSATHFLYTEFTDSDFSGANFSTANLSFTDIFNSVFAGATFPGAILDDALIQFSDFSDADFGTGTAASFRRATVRAGQFDRANFQGVDFTDTQFRCIIDPAETSPTGFSTVCPTFINTDFRDANLSSTLFAPAFGGDKLVVSNADFRGVDFTGAILAGIADPCLQTDPVNNVWSCMRWDGDPATTDTNFVSDLTLLTSSTTQTTRGSDLRGSDLRNLNFIRGSFPLVTIAGTQFAGSKFADTDFEDAIATCEVIDLTAHDPSDLDYDEVVADHDAEVELCAYLAGIGQLEADFRDTLFSGGSFQRADLDGASFADAGDVNSAGASLSDVDFSDASLRGTDFTDASFSNVVLDRVTLGCNASPNDFATHCAECAIFSGVFAGQPGPVAGKYSIQMRGVDFDGIVGCSALRVAGGPLIDDFANVDLNGGSFKGVDVTVLSSASFTGASLVSVSFDGATLSGLDFGTADLSQATLTQMGPPCLAGGGACMSFVAANLAGADLSQSDFQAVNFTNANLDGAGAINAEFAGANFAGSSMIAALLSSARFDGASFDNADLSGSAATCLPDANTTVCASFNGATFANATLVDVAFVGADLRGASFAGADLSGANFSGSQFDATTSLGTAQIDGLDLRGVDLTLASPSLFANKPDFVPDTSLGEDASDALGVELGASDLTGFNFSGLELRNWNFDQAVIANANFTGADLQGAAMTNVALDSFFASLTIDHPSSFLKGVDLTGTNLSGVVLENFDLTASDLSGAVVCAGGAGCADLTNAKLGCAELGSTNLPLYAVRDAGGALVGDATQLFQFVAANLSGIKLANANLSGYDFSGLILPSSDLMGSDLRGADFTGANLRGSRLANATLCNASGTADCPIFSNTTLLTTSVDCNDQQAVDFSGVSFVNAPTNLFVGNSVACVNFSGANLSYADATRTTGFDFSDLANFDGAVLAGAALRFQNFSTAAPNSFPLNFFQQLGHALPSRDDICSADDDNVAAVDTSPDLRATIFSCADLSGQDLSNTDLRDAEFVRTTVGGTGFALSGAKLEGADFGDVDLSADALAAVFQGVASVVEDDGNPDTLDPPVTDDNGVAYPNLRNLSLVHTNLESVTVTFDLHHVDLSGATLDGANLAGAKLTDALLDDLTSLCGAYATSASDPNLCPRKDNTLTTCLNLAGATLAGASFRNVDFSELFESEVPTFVAKEFFQDVGGGRDLTRTDFSGANLAGLNLDDVDFTDAIFNGLARVCDAALGCASFERAAFGSSDADLPISLSAFDFEEANVAGASFRNVNLAFADLSSAGALCTADVTPVCLEISGKNSSLQSASLMDLDLTQVDFGSGTAKLINFRGASFERATLAGLDLSGRDFTAANFSAADLTAVNFDGAILASMSSGCQTVNVQQVCTIFDDIKICGVDARGAHFEGSFERVDTVPPAGCSQVADFGGASFANISLASASFENAVLEAASFASSVAFCSADGASCLDLTGARLMAAKLSNIDFGSAPDSFFDVVADRDLSQVDFSQSNLSGKIFENADLSFADLSRANLQSANLRGVNFDKTEFASGAVSDGTRCTLAAGGSPADLRGAFLKGADLSRALHFQRGCILVDATTSYDQSTRFPAGFDLLGDLTIEAANPPTPAPEPSAALLQATALATMAWLLRRRRQD